MPRIAYKQSCFIPLASSIADIHKSTLRLYKFCIFLQVGFIALKRLILDTGEI